MNSFQRKALEVYAHGMFNYPDGLKEPFGDTLLNFILIELSDNEDCGDLETAIQRIESGIHDLQTVLEALQS